MIFARLSKTHALLLLGFGLGLSNCRCDPGTVQSLRPILKATPKSIEFATKPLAVESRAALTIQNIGDAPLEISKITIRNFSFGHDFTKPVFLAPAESVAIALRVRSSTLGILRGTLMIESDDNNSPHTIDLRFSSVPAPRCDDGNACTADIFDPVTESCKHQYLNGASCESADRCVINASCLDGVCLGQPKICSDNSPCTHDFCRQIDGVCVFVTDDSVCDDGNPCTKDSCTRAGCNNDPTENGTACDDEDQCTHSDACFGGQCLGQAANENEPCDDQNSCTSFDHCENGVCLGRSIIDPAREGELVFAHRLNAWNRAFMHRREVSLSDDDILYVLDHHPLEPPQGMAHVISSLKQCGTRDYEFSYQPPDGLVFVRYVRREMQLKPDNSLRICVGVRQLPENGYAPQTTTYVLDRRGRPINSEIRALGGETGRALLPDGSHIYGMIWPLSQGAPTETEPAMQNLVLIREDRSGQILWRHERSSLDWAEFLAVAGPRVLYWSNFRFGALDFNTGASVWTSATNFIAKEMAVSTQMNLGVARVGMAFRHSQILGVELLNGQQTFLFPLEEDLSYLPRTDPVIAGDGRILVMMQRSQLAPLLPLGLDWVELGPDGRVISNTPLPYTFPQGFEATRVEDDPYITVAEDGVAYVGYGDQFWAINPGGQIRWTVSSTLAHGFTGSVPLLRDDSIILVSDGHRRILGIKSNGARISQSGWPSFRHDNRRTNFAP